MSDKQFNPQQDIADLMNLYHQEVKDHPELPNRETLLLRARLVFEEAKEFVEACGCKINGLDSVAGDLVVTDPDLEPNFKEYVDGCVDQMVVTIGALSAAGVKVEPAWDEVQRSNMSKTFMHCSVCDQELIFDRVWGWCHQVGELGTCPDWKEVPKIHKRADGKVIKPSTYSPANIAKVISDQVDQYLQNLPHVEEVA
jgi:predicted HAD superfamily Cof-like phosphohydrolase